MMSMFFMMHAPTRMSLETPATRIPPSPCRRPGADRQRSPTATKVVVGFARGMRSTVAMNGGRGWTTSGHPGDNLDNLGTTSGIPQVLARQCYNVARGTTSVLFGSTRACCATVPPTPTSPTSSLTTFSFFFERKRERLSFALPPKDLGCPEVVPMLTSEEPRLSRTAFSADHGFTFGAIHTLTFRVPTFFRFTRNLSLLNAIPILTLGCARRDGQSAAGAVGQRGSSSCGCAAGRPPSATRRSSLWCRRGRLGRRVRRWIRDR